MYSGIAELKQELKKAKNFIQRVRQRSPIPSLTLPRKKIHGTGPRQATMSFKLASLLVYTVGVKCRGINKKEAYAPEHVFSLSENTAHKMLRESRVDLIKHTRTHIVRTYPKGLRLGSSNYEPHHFWSAGAQLVAINWQTCGA
jgi:phosphatidylinositol phospholipase C delta